MYWAISSFAIILVVVVDKAQSARCPAHASGLYKHPTDCNRYLNCDNGRTFVQQCAPGTLFSPSLGVCDHAGSVDCNSGGGGTSGGGGGGGGGGGTYNGGGYSPPPNRGNDRYTPPSNTRGTGNTDYGGGDGDFGGQDNGAAYPDYDAGQEGGAYPDYGAGQGGGHMPQGHGGGGYKPSRLDKINQGMDALGRASNIRNNHRQHSNSNPRPSRPNGPKIRLPKLGGKKKKWGR